MSEFKIIAKHWPSGDTLPLGAFGGTFTIPPSMPSFQNTADEYVTIGTQQYQFLFWNTGRRLTKKRRVLWNFSRPGWSIWTATKWYGIPPGSVVPPPPPGYGRMPSRSAVTRR